MKVLLDTNILLAPFQYSIRIFEEIERVLLTKPEYYVLDKTIKELERIRDFGKKLKYRLQAKMALQLIKEEGIKVIYVDDKRRVDEILLDLAKKENFIVATLDKNLKKRLIREGVKVIYLRGDHLEISW